jgi:hypothetical protein
VALPLPRLPRGTDLRSLDLAPGLADLDRLAGGPVAPVDVRTCLRHRAYWLASCSACREARRLTLHCSPANSPNTPARL